MGKNKKPGGVKNNVFKVAGAKSLKKTKSKAVNLGLKNIKKTVAEIDKQFVEISKQPQSNKASEHKKPQIKFSKSKPSVKKEEISDAASKIEKMDL